MLETMYTKILTRVEPELNRVRRRNRPWPMGDEMDMWFSFVNYQFHRQAWRRAIGFVCAVGVTALCLLIVLGLWG